MTIELRPARSTGEWLTPYLSILLVFAHCTSTPSFYTFIGAKPLSKPRSGNRSRIHYGTEHCGRYDSVSLHPDQAQFQSGLIYKSDEPLSHVGSGSLRPGTSGGQSNQRCMPITQRVRVYFGSPHIGIHDRITYSPLVRPVCTLAHSNSVGEVLTMQSVQWMNITSRMI